VRVLVSSIAQYRFQWRAVGERGNEFTNFTKGSEFLDQLGKYQFPTRTSPHGATVAVECRGATKDTVPWSYW
jgi:hypothetical protein